MPARMPFVCSDRFIPCADPVETDCSEEASPAPHWFLFHRGRLLVSERDGNCRLPGAGKKLLGLVKTDTVLGIGVLNGRPCRTASLSAEGPLPAGHRLARLRSLFGQLGDDSFAVAGRALQLLQWQRDHRFCGRCGTPAVVRRAEFAMECPSCGLVAFPRISPAVIMAVTRGPQILLVRAPHFPKGMFSTLAGFVEPGETLEQAVMREVKEETSVSVACVRYFGNQPWPFPHSLMLGFTACWEEGDIRREENEIEEAGWFPLDELPRIPSKMSIARALIDHCRSARR
jgi:NAD+ diphosphatase